MPGGWRVLKRFVSSRLCPHPGPSRGCSLTGHIVHEMAARSGLGHELLGYLIADKGLCSNLLLILVAHAAKGIRVDKVSLLHGLGGGGGKRFILRTQITSFEESR